MSFALRFGSLLLAAATVAPAVQAGSVPAVPLGTPAQPTARPTTRQVQEGIAVDFSATPSAPSPGALREGDDAVFRFKISDTATATALSGATPAAWVEALPDGQAAAQKCTTRVQELLSGSFWTRPQIDLNAYFVLALNDDPSISVVDPLSGFGGTKLLTLITLESPGEDWALTADRSRLFVSLPDKDRVAVIDTATWKVVSSLAVGPRPGRLALQPDGAYLWVTLGGGTAKGGGSRSDGSHDPADPGVAVVAVRDLKLVKTLRTGAGPHQIVLTDDSRFADVANGAARTVSVVDVAKLARTHDVALGFAPTSLAFSPLSRAAYAVGGAEGTIAAVDAAGKVVARIRSDPGLGALRFAPGGRLGFVPNAGTKSVHILDVSANRIVQTAEVGDDPDQITFTDTLAYVRLKGSETVKMIPLAQVGVAGKPVPVADFPAGQNPLGQVTRPSPADSIVQAPESGAVLVASPADHAIYYYTEGMAAPKGSFSGYDREPRALLVVDRSLKEKSPGSYETVAHLAGPGRYRVAFFLDTPRTVQCFELTVAADPRLEAQRRAERPLAVEPLLASTATVGETVHLRFRLTDPNTKEPAKDLTDVSVLAFEAGGWHERKVARPLGDGVYETDLVPGRAGSYVITVECPSRRLPFHLSPQAVLSVTEAAPASAATSPRRER